MGMTKVMGMKTQSAGVIVNIILIKINARHVYCGVSLVVTIGLSTENSRHAGTEALALSQYATFDNIQFSLRYSDCVCQPCYKDFTRNRNNVENKIPRWMKVKNEVYQQLYNQNTA